MRLENHVNTACGALLGCLQCRANFCRVVSVVVHYEDAVHLALELEAPIDAAEALECVLNAVDRDLEPDADSLYILDIYPASEQPIPGVTGEMLAQKITEAGKPATHISSMSDAVTAAASNAKSGDVIMTLGAGSVYQLGPQNVEALKARMATK